MRRLGLVLVVGLLAVPCARADSGGTVRARLVAEVDAGLAAADRRWVWQGWYQDYQGTPGWDPASGGIWWNTQQTVKAAESVTRRRCSRSSCTRRTRARRISPLPSG